MMSAIPKKHAKRVLLTVLGMDPKQTTYTLEGREATSNLAPAALVSLLGERRCPDLVVALCTQEAREKSFCQLEQAVSKTCEVRCIDVRLSATQESVKEFLARAVDGVPDGDVDLVVDITHGFRHFSILTYVVALYLVALGKVRLEAVYYGILRQNQPNTPFLDLRPLLELPRWIHAIDVFRDTGSAQPIAKILQSTRNDNISRRLSCALSRISQAFLSGLPIELGREARVFVDQLQRPLRQQLDRTLPLGDELSSRLKKVLTEFALEDLPSGAGWKRKVPISPNELQRQARIIDALFDGKHISTALGLLSEWTVSWVVWHLGRTNEWLDYRDARWAAANVLGALAAAKRDPDLTRLLTDEQEKIAEYWQDLSNLRNAYHHQGMRGQDLIGDETLESQIRKVRDIWNKMLRTCTMDLSLDPGSDGGTVLVTPLGMRPGVLFSALRACAAGSGFPEKCFVICSEQTAKSAAGAAERAGFTGVIEKVLIDPFGGPAEINALIKKIRPEIFRAKQVLVNITGGTTLMGLAAEKIAAEALNLARPVRRFGLIDRRRSGEQEADPYQVGELFWVDEEKTDGDRND